jgi:hypothetical protein
MTGWCSSGRVLTEICEGTMETHKRTLARFKGIEKAMVCREETREITKTQVNLGDQADLGNNDGLWSEGQ